MNYPKKIDYFKTFNDIEIESRKMYSTMSLLLLPLICLHKCQRWNFCILQNSLSTSKLEFLLNAQVPQS